MKLIEEIKKQRFYKAKKMVAEASLSRINEVDERGSTPLIWAAASGEKELVKELLNRGADFKVKNKFGITASGAAKASGNIPSMRAIGLAIKKANSPKYIFTNN